jgi:hypothetical protein
MPIPSRPTPYFILIQADLAFGFFKTLFHGPAAAGDLHDGFQHGPMQGKHHVRRQLRGGAQTPAHQEPPAPVELQGRGQGEPRPVLPARAFGPVASAQPTPPLWRQRCQDRFDLLLPAATPDIFLARDGQDMGVAVFL